jgi:hypothetical protein
VLLFGEQKNKHVYCAPADDPVASDFFTEIKIAHTTYNKSISNSYKRSLPDS